MFIVFYCENFGDFVVFLIYQVVLDCIMYTFNIVLWHSGPVKILSGVIYFFGYFLADNQSS